MALTEAQKRAQENYRKKSVKQAAVRFYPAEADIWEWLQSQEFDYQSDRHCSKTCQWPCRRWRPFDYQSDRHCSKTL